MTHGDFEKALAEAGAELDRRARSEVLQGRLRARLQRSRGAGSRARTGLRRLALAASLAAAFGIGLAVRPLLQPAPRPSLAGLAVLEASPDLQVSVGPGDRLAVLGGRCRLEEERGGITLEIQEPADLRREEAGLRLLSGSATFTVRKQPPGRTARVLVSGGIIEVQGTRFTVVQGRGAGSVALHEGRISFVAADGRVVALQPGGSLRWPLPAPVAEPPAPAPAPAPALPRAGNGASPVRPPAPAPAQPEARRPEPAGAAPILDRIATLRSRGEYPEAVRLLESSLASSLPAESKELLSYELGAILTYHLGDPERACRHWRDHAGRFPAGRYLREVAAARASLGCGEEAAQ